MEYDVFISYRRQGSADLARLLHEKLATAGLSVFLDLEELRGGTFDEKLYAAIENSRNVVVLLPAGALDRCSDPQDWLRLEIEHALKSGVNLVPVMMPGFDWPGTMPPTISEFSRYNGIKWSHVYYDASIRKLESLLVDISKPASAAHGSSDAENVFLSRARRFKRNDGVIDPTERAELDELADKFGIDVVRREALIERVESGEDGSRPTDSIPAKSEEKPDDEIPALGKRVSDLPLTSLSGSDAKHFKAALTHYRVLRRRAALQELDAIENKNDPIVRYYSLKLRYELDGEVSDADMESACVAARDLGCTNAMDSFADRHLNGDGFDPVGKVECIAWLKKAIENGNADALATLGGAYEDGKGVQKNPSLARALYLKSASADSIDGRTALGYDYLSGGNGEKNIVEAAKWLRPIVSHFRDHEDDLGSVEFFLLAMCFATGDIFERNVKQAVRYCERAIAVKGSTWGDRNKYNAANYLLLGMLLLAGDGVEKDEKRAFECLLAAKNLDSCDGAAEWQLANCYENGLGIDPDPKKAEALLREASDRGNAAAQFQLAIRYFDDGPDQNVVRGKALLDAAVRGDDEDALMLKGTFLVDGVYYEQNTSAGLELLEKAAASGSAEAMNRLGELYRGGSEGIEPNSEKAVQWFQRGAETGSAEAMENLGLSLLAGNGIRRDVKAAETWLRKSAELGNASAECSLGTRYYDGDFGERNLGEAAAWWEKAAEHGDTVAMNNLSQFYRDPDNGSPDLKKAEEWLVRAAESGNADAACLLGACYHRGDFGESDIRKALEWTRKGAAQGDATAMSNLGIMYRDGDGVEKNPMLAADWFRRAADAGHPVAMTNLGLALLFGDGVPKDEKEGNEWLEKAFAAGDSDGALVLGNRYLNEGEGDEAKRKAVEWWTKAAEQGNPSAMYRLSLAYQNGYGVESDSRISFEWLRKSAEAGDPSAMEDLGIAYLNGNGVAIDWKKAEDWLVRAAENGNESAECSLGTRFAHGDFGVRNLDNAIQWWEKAAEHGDAVAMANLGVVYSDGSIPVDLDKARRWFSQAAEAGNEGANYYIAIDSLGWLGAVPSSYDEWSKRPVAEAMEAEQALRFLRKAYSWFSRPVEAKSEDADLVGACLLWMARIARFAGDETEAKSLYGQSVKKGNMAAAQELREMTAPFFRIKKRIRSAFGRS